MHLDLGSTASWPGSPISLHQKHRWKDDGGSERNLIERYIHHNDFDVADGQFVKP